MSTAPNDSTSTAAREPHRFERDQAERLLRVLLADVPGQAVLYQLGIADPSKDSGAKGAFRREKFATLDQLLDAAAAAVERAEPRNVYFAAPLFGGSPGRLGASATDACAAWCVWCDFDQKPGGPTWEEAFAASKLPPPSALIATGGPGNRQAFWLLTTPAIFTPTVAGAEATRTHVGDVLRGIQHALGGKEAGADSVTDLARVMRVPGTANWPNKKKAAEGRTMGFAQLLELHPERRYSLVDFPRRADEKRSKKSKRTATGGRERDFKGRTEADLPEHLRQALAAHQYLRQAFDRTRSGGDASVDDLVLAKEALRVGLSDDDAWLLVQVSRAIHVGDTKAEREDYEASTLANAHEELEAERARKAQGAFGGKANHAGGDSKPSGHSILGNLRPFDSIPLERISYLIRPYIPAGMLTLVDGDPAGGKSAVLFDIAARITRGQLALTGDLPPDPNNSGSVIILNCEDPLESVVKPRLIAAGADGSRLHIFDGVWHAQNIFGLTEAIEKFAPKAVILDVLMSAMGAKLNTSQDAEVRAALLPLVQLAARHSVAVIAGRHLHKGEKTKALYAGMSSIAFGALARSVLLIGVNPTMPRAVRSDERLLAPVKMNNTQQARVPTLRFTLVPTAVDDPRVAGETYPAVEWLGEAEVTADEMVATPKEDQRSPARRALCNFLVRFFVSHGPTPGHEVEAAALAAGLKCDKRAWAKAREDAEVEAVGRGPAAVWQPRGFTASPEFSEGDPLSGAA